MSSTDDDINDIQKLYAELQAEIDFFVTKDEGYIDPTALSSVQRRLFVRSVFAFIEASVFRLKSGALFWDTSKLLPQEIAFINEEDYELDDRGTVITRRARLRFSGNFRFAFAVAAKAAGVTYQLDLGGDGWGALSDALKVRDRLMHPKRSADLVVTDAEVRGAMEAFEWVMDQMERLMAVTLLHGSSAAKSNSSSSQVDDSANSKIK